MNKDARCMYLVRIKLARLDDNLRLGNGDLAACRRVGVEVARRSPIDEIPQPIGLPGFYQSQIGLNATLKDIRHAVEVLMFFSLGHQRATPVRV